MSASKTYGYCRVSTSRQAREGISLTDQQAAIVAYCTLKDLPPPTIVVDPGTSGKVPFAEREAGEVIVRAVRHGDHIVMTRIDRGFRNLTDFLHWFDAWLGAGVHLHVINFGGNQIDPRTSIGRLVFRVLAVVAELERETHSERIRDAHQHFRERGLTMNGTARVGFRSEPVPGGGFRSVPDPEMRRWMSALVEMWQEKKMTQTQIVNYLNARGEPHPGQHRSARKPTRFDQGAISKYIHAELQLRAQEGRIPYDDES